MDKYDYGLASSTLYNFVYNDFCSFYLEMSKVSLQNKEEETLNVLLYCLKAILMMIYPFSPFISEEIYLNLPEHKESIMLESYPEYNKKYRFNNLEVVTMLSQIIEKVRNYKSINKISPSASLELAIKTTLDLNSIMDYLKRFTFSNEISLISEDQENSTTYSLTNGTLFIKDNINKDELLKSLNEQKEKLLNEVKRSENLLNNKNFLEKAKKEKIELEKQKYIDYKNQLNDILEKISKI